MRAQHDGDRVADDDTRHSLAAELRIERVAKCLLEVLGLCQTRDGKVEEELFVHGEMGWGGFLVMV